MPKKTVVLNFNATDDNKSANVEKFSKISFQI